LTIVKKWIERRKNVKKKYWEPLRRFSRPRASEMLQGRFPTAKPRRKAWMANRVIVLHVLISLLGIGWGVLRLGSGQAQIEAWVLVGMFGVLLVLGLFLWSEWRFSENDELGRVDAG